MVRRKLSFGLLVSALVAVAISAAVAAAASVPASRCSGTLSPRPGNHAFYIKMACKSGRFSSFKVAMNYALYTTPTAQAVINNKVHSFSCKKSTTTSFSCSGVTVPANKMVSVGVDEHAYPCSKATSPPISVAVTIASDKFHPVWNCS